MKWYTGGVSKGVSFSFSLMPAERKFNWPYHSIGDWINLQNLVPHCFYRQLALAIGDYAIGGFGSAPGGYVSQSAHSHRILRGLCCWRICSCSDLNLERQSAGAPIGIRTCISDYARVSACGLCYRWFWPLLIYRQRPMPYCGDLHPDMLLATLLKRVPYLNYNYI